MLSKLVKICIVSLIYRILFVIITQTAFVPDEYFQFGEVSYTVAFGKGILTWEWLPEYRIRSSLLVYLFARILRLAHSSIDKFAVIVPYLPRLFQIVFTVSADVAFYFIAQCVFPSKIFYGVAEWAFAINLCSWSLSYCMIRPLSNSMETCFIIIGTSYILKKKYTTVDLVMFALMLVLSVYLRPSAVLYWIPLLTGLLFNGYFGIMIILKIAAVFFGTLIAAMLADAINYGEFTNPVFNFYRVNLTENYASLYGVNSLHWNFSQGLPVMLALYVPFVCYGLLHLTFQSSLLLRVLVATSISYAAALNVFSAHQEFRFLLPCLPGLHLLVAWTFSTLSNNRQVYKSLFATLIFAQVAAAVYLATRHQAGGEAAAKFISGELLPKLCKNISLSSIGDVVNIYQLGPCHSFPGYIYFHSDDLDVRLYFPDCSAQYKKIGITESTVFESNPVAFYRQKSISSEREDNCFYNTLQNPNQRLGLWGEPHIVLTYDSYPELETSLNEGGFKKIKSFKHTDFKYDYDDPEIKKNVLVFVSENVSNALRMFV